MRQLRRRAVAVVGSHTAVHPDLGIPAAGQH